MGKFFKIIILVFVFSALANGATLDNANELKAEIQSVYHKEFNSISRQLLFTVSDSENVDAWTSFEKGIAQIQITHGLILHPLMDKDGLALILCHEIGHHLGGAPHKIGYKRPRGPGRPGPKIPFKSWSSAEGQADFYTTSVCVRRLWLDQDNRVYREMATEQIIQLCDGKFADTDQSNICIRTLLASQKQSLFIAETSKWPISESPQIGVSLPASSKLIYDHSSPQCRLNTFATGALCLQPKTIDGGWSCGDDDFSSERLSCWMGMYLK